MDQEIIHTSAAPGVVGPYSQGVRAGGFIFTAGQIALDPATGKMVGETIEEQTRRVLDNLKAVLEAAGGRVLTFDGAPLRYNTKESLLNPEFFAIGDPAFAWGDVLPPYSAPAPGESGQSAPT